MSDLLPVLAAVVLSVSVPERLSPEGFRELLVSDPVAAFLWSVRTGEVPDTAAMVDRTRELLREDPAAARTGAWACWSAGVALESATEPALLEFSDETVMPAITGLERDQLLIRAVLLRPLHRVAMGMDTDTTGLLSGFVIREWPVFSVRNRVLALQTLGRLGIDVSPDLGQQLGQAGPAALARYSSELGLGLDGVPPVDAPVLERVYAAGAVPVDSLPGFLTDPHWAVRCTAAGRAPLEELAPLLDDSVPYVRLAAALRLAGAGDGTACGVVGELVGMPGPVGQMAVSGLGPDDSGLLLELLESPENGKRTAALGAWMDLGLPLEEERIREFSRNGHWLVPLFLAWMLEDAGDHPSAMIVYDTVMEDTARYDEPYMLRAELTSVLGLPDTVPSPDMTLLPFDPDTVHVPDTLMMATDIGQFRIVLWKDLAPVTCASFTWLARSGFYDGIWFHRVIPGFVAQAGCPDATGMGGPGYTLPGERSLAAFTRGVVGMADAGLDTGGSQFFVMLDDHDRLDGRYTAFGEVVPCDGLDDITVGTRILWMGDYRR